MTSSSRLYLGCYTAAAHASNAQGLGVASCAFDPATGTFSELTSRAAIDNPSWVMLDAEGSRLFAVSERGKEPGAVHGFRVGNDGSLLDHSEVSSEGLATCHLAAGRDYLYAASYSDGRLTAVPLQGGAIVGRPTVIQYEGSGPNAKRQQGPHAHQATLSPDGRWLFVCDLGSDRIWRHALHDGLPGDAEPISTPPGYGPRHLAWDTRRDRVYVHCELMPRVLTYRWDAAAGTLTLDGECRINDIPGLAGVGWGAAIHLHPSGRWLGISERTEHSVILFSLEDGLRFHQRVPSQEKVPRDFRFTADGRWLLVAYQDSSALLSFAMSANGQIDATPADRLEVGTPVCIAQAP